MVPIRSKNTIIESGKRYDHIVEVEKFNPFHDAKGRFANKNGFASYSANPNTKAGAMAISRSAAAGHGSTANVHRQSYGENITQNANWIGSNSDWKSRFSPNSNLRGTIERKNGLRGASAAGAKWQQQNARQDRFTRPEQNTAPTKPSPPATPKKPAQPKKPSTPNQDGNNLNGFKGVANGKDISATFQYNPTSKKSAVQQAAEAQGFTAKPRLVDYRAFCEAAKETGVIGIRTWSDGTDVVTKQRVSAQVFKDALSHSDTFSLNGSGGQAYGGGMYMATNKRVQQGDMPKGKNLSDAVSGSLAYGYVGHRKSAAITLDPSAKVGNGDKVSDEFSNLSKTEKSHFDWDVGAYAAAKGYDALRWNGAGGSCDYTTVFNRTKLIVLDDPSNSAFGIRD